MVGPTGVNQNKLSFVLTLRASELRFSFQTLCVCELAGTSKNKIKLLGVNKKSPLWIRLIGGFFIKWWAQLDLNQ